MDHYTTMKETYQQAALLEDAIRDAENTLTDIEVNIAELSETIGYDSTVSDDYAAALMVQLEEQKDKLPIAQEAVEKLADELEVVNTRWIESRKEIDRLEEAAWIKEDKKAEQGPLYQEDFEGPGALWSRPDFPFGTNRVL